MKLLENKKILITGLLSNRSIAYGVAKSCHSHGAEIAFTYQSDRFKDRVVSLGSEFNSKIFLPCDVTNDDQIESLFKQLNKQWNHIDGILHAIAFSPKEGLTGDFVDNVNREVFQIANDITAYSFNALAKYSRPFIHNGSLVTLSYIGSQRVVTNYNMAGVAKAALESMTKYMASSLGNDGIRVNAISAGPIKTLAASGITGFNNILEHVKEHSPLKKNITIEEVGDVAVFLFSNLSRAITGEIIHVDAGYNIVNTI